SASSWEELAQNDGIFALYYMSELGKRIIIAKLQGDPGNENSGNIVAISDYMDEFTPLTQIGAWKKSNIHGQSIIRLAHSGTDPNLGLDPALAIVHGQIVMAWYNVPGSAFSRQVFNAEAGTALSNAAVGIFPIPLTE
ncbi:MAG TPA: hypothetical protein VM553_14230, partial [Dongiaceae bacterium]|nr:hypothetical protein [Dongiaceae bacterium]